MKDIETYRVAFFGHRDFSDDIKFWKILFEIVENILKTHVFVEFYVGRNGEFDIFSASVIKSVQKKLGKENSNITLILPYQTSHIEDYEKYYDSIIIPEHIADVHPKNAINKRNQWIVERADFLIFYVTREKGGAYNAMKLAENFRKELINLSNHDLRKTD